MKRLRSTAYVLIFVLLLSSLFTYPNQGFVTSVSACSTWQVGQRIGLRGGSEIRQGSGLGYNVHTIVPEDNWQVDIIDGPRSADGYTWWDISRQNLDGGGTGWVYIEQAGYDVCNTNPPQSNPPSAPGLSSPGDGTYWQQNTSIVLQWNSASNASRYKVELWGGPYNTMTPCDWQSDTSCTIGTMWPGVMYWKVKARDNNGLESDWSSTWSFTIQEIIQQPQEPTSQSPSNPGSPNPTSQSPSNPGSPNPTPQDATTSGSQTDACPGFVKDHISGFSNPPAGRYIYVPSDIDKLRLRKSHSTDSCAYGWLTPQNYYSVIKERNDGWIQIDTGIGQGWVVGEYVSIDTNPQSNPSIESQSSSNGSSTDSSNNATQNSEITTPPPSPQWCDAEVIKTYRAFWPLSDLLDIVLIIRTPSVSKQADVKFLFDEKPTPVDFLYLEDYKWKISIGMFGDASKWQFQYLSSNGC